MIILAERRESHSNMACPQPRGSCAVQQVLEQHRTGSTGLESHKAEEKIQMAMRTALEVVLSRIFTCV
jgi:hypothetical protein